MGLSTESRSRTHRIPGNVREMEPDDLVVVSHGSSFYVWRGRGFGRPRLRRGAGRNLNAAEVAFQEQRQAGACFARWYEVV